MKKTLTILLVLVLLLSCLPVGAAAAGGKETKRAIAIVYDNSGSMYIGSEEQRKAWCQATYATEAFAAMMNPSDVLRVYPMNPIEVDGKTYTYDQPLEVNQKSASTIRKIFSKPGDTHIETIAAGCEDILTVKADEYWLVVVTDGDEFYRNGKGLGKSKTVSELEKDLSASREKLNVMYLGMGSQTAMPKDVTGSYYYEAKKTQNGAQVLEALNSMCNTIFGRDTLPDVGSTVSFDLSMNKLILFVQGDGIKNVKLGNLKPDSTVEMKYSELGAGGSYATKFVVDTSLQGQLLTFTNVDAGDFALSYEGQVSSIDCYYEPDVDVQMTLTDEAGNPVPSDTDPIYGTYYVHYNLVDKNGKPVESKLLKETKYTIKYTQNGQQKVLEADKGGKLKLDMKEGDTLEDASVKVVYLGGYSREKTAADLKWPKFTFVAPEAGWLNAKMSGGSSEYKLSQVSAGEAFKAEFVYDGAPLTDAQLKKGEKDHLKINIEGGNAGYTYEIKDNAVYVTPKAYDVQYETDCGKYTVHVSYTYYNDDNKATNQATASGSFEIKDDSRQLKMMLSAPQNYYELSKLAEGKPIILHFDYSGDDLTEEELNALNITYNAEGLTLIKEVKAEESAVHFRLDPSNPPAEGKYKLSFAAAGVNEVGREQSCEGRCSIEISALPLWLKILIPILIIAAIITLIVLILNQKVLPKKMVLQNIHFKVTGPAITKGGNAIMQAPGKKRSAITITTPASVYAGAKQTFTLELVAETNRITPYNQKKYMIEKVTVGKYVYEYDIKGIKYQRDRKTGQFMGPGKKPFKPILAGPGTVIGVKAKTIEGNNVNYSCKLVNSK